MAKGKDNGITILLGLKDYVLADHIGNTGLRILASSFSIYSTGAR